MKPVPLQLLTNAPAGHGAITGMKAIVYALVALAIAAGVAWMFRYTPISEDRVWDRWGQRICFAADVTACIGGKFGP